MRNKALRSAIELAWAAGFFDGEGWSSAIKGTAFTMGAAQKDLRPLARFVLALEVETTIHHGRIYSVVFSGEKAFTVGRALWPYLCAPKREQLVRAFDTAHGGRSRRYPRLNAQYDEMADFLEARA